MATRKQLDLKKAFQEAEQARAYLWGCGLISRGENDRIKGRMLKRVKQEGMEGKVRFFWLGAK